ncbi:MAG: DEAD/DEAH box helicase family protein [Chloroflexi bacterium]|nr:DEAD/DEAH box helicase family protein [Chloroflexota bacterium]MBI3341372.1 DEAD/DEAH box helicase family protein [Chloroflexota bacterium]
MPTPEELARINIDKQLTACGWIVQSRGEMNLYAGRGVAVREFPLSTGEADYLLFVDRKAVGVVEAKPEGVTLSGVADQAAKYSIGLPANIPHVTLPLPFLYESTGVETFFRDERDPEPRSRRVFTFHRPEELADLLIDGDTLRARLRNMPKQFPLITTGLWGTQVEAINNLEKSLAENRPRALIQMATGSGKTFTAVSFVYRLIKHAKAKRVLFLVDRNNLGRQAFKEFDQYLTPDDGRKFTELYNVQHLQSNVLDSVSKVHITSIQRLYSMLSGEPEFDAANEEGSLFEMGAALDAQPPKEIRYNPNFPIEYYDFIVVDECHRSIYNLWRGVLEYFDAFLIGLTATPSKQTFGFFKKNLVMEYPRLRAIADGVNVQGEVYRIRTQISEQGSNVEAGFYIGKRERMTRAERWEKLDEDFEYDPRQLDREVVSVDQIRTVLRTYRDKLFTEMFPDREIVPKTLIFAKDDSHAEDIVRIVREEFGRGDEFCQKITYRSTGRKPEDLISDFRNSYFPRIAVTVDMIATGTDIKPLEVLLFMRAVKSRLLFEQMLGRGTRVVSQTELQNVTSDAKTKDRFVLIDAVGIVESELADPQTLERKRSASLKQLLESVAMGVTDEDTLSSLAGRLVRLAKSLGTAEQAEVKERSGGLSLADLSNRLLDAIDPDKIQEAESQNVLIDAAVRPLASNPELRARLTEMQTRHEQAIDEVSQDAVIEARFTDEASRLLVRSFEEYIAEHKDEITALEIIYSIPYRTAKSAKDAKKEERGKNPGDTSAALSASLSGLRGEKNRLTFEALKKLAETLQQPPRSWTTEALWRAYAQLERDRVRGAGSRRVLTDLVSLVRHAVQLDDELVPYPERVQRRYAEWLASQQAEGKTFTAEQRWWLDQVATHIGVNLEIHAEDFNYGEFFNRGGQVAALRTFGPQLKGLLDELNERLNVDNASGRE